MKIIDKRIGMPKAPYFCKDEKGRISVMTNGEHIDKKWLRKCRDVLNKILETETNL